MSLRKTRSADESEAEELAMAARAATRHAPRRKATKSARGRLQGKTVAILATDGFEQSELQRPLRALQQAGARVEIVSPKAGRIRGWKDGDWASSVAVKAQLKAAVADSYDALVLPGGTLNADHLRMDPLAVNFVKGFVDAGKPIAAICHAPWILIEAGAVQGRRLTSWPSLRSDLRNAGAEWLDEEVVNDRCLVTSRKPEDLAAFCREAIEVFAHKRDKRVRIGPSDIS